MTVKLENERIGKNKLSVELENGRILGPYASVPTTYRKYGRISTLCYFEINPWKIQIDP